MDRRTFLKTGAAFALCPAIPVTVQSYPRRLVHPGKLEMNILCGPENHRWTIRGSAKSTRSGFSGKGWECVRVDAGYRWSLQQLRGFEDSELLMELLGRLGHRSDVDLVFPDYRIRFVRPMLTDIGRTTIRRVREFPCGLPGRIVCRRYLNNIRFMGSRMEVLD